MKISPQHDRDDASAPDEAGALEIYLYLSYSYFFYEMAERINKREDEYDVDFEYVPLLPPSPRPRLTLLLQRHQRLRPLPLGRHPRGDLRRAQHGGQAHAGRAARLVGAEARAGGAEGGSAHRGRGQEADGTAGPAAALAVRPDCLLHEGDAAAPAVHGSALGHAAFDHQGGFLGEKGGGIGADGCDSCRMIRMRS